MNKVKDKITIPFIDDSNPTLTDEGFIDEPTFIDDSNPLERSD